MFACKEGAGSLYWQVQRDENGAYLDGGKSYKLSVPQPVPQTLFWSVTVYDPATRSMIQTDQNEAALRSIVELKDVPKTGSTDLYFGPKAPEGKEGQWIKTNPGRYRSVPSNPPPAEGHCSDVALKWRVHFSRCQREVREGRMPCA